MQLGTTVVLATVWLAVYANLVGTLRINFTADQYSPLAPQHRRHEVYRRAEGQPSVWKDPNSGEYQLDRPAKVDLSIKSAPYAALSSGIRYISNLILSLSLFLSLFLCHTRYCSRGVAETERRP